MSTVGRVIIGVICLVSGLGFVMTALYMQNDWILLLLAGFCFAASLAMLARGRVARVSGGLVGLGLFLMGLAYLGYEVVQGVWISGSLGQPSVLNAVHFLLIFSLPGLAYAFSVRRELGMGRRREE